MKGYGFSEANAIKISQLLAERSVDVQQEFVHILYTQSKDEAVTFINSDDLWASPGFLDANKKMLVNIFNQYYKPQQEKGRPCPTCRSNDTSVFMQQLRSADEPASVITFCNSCGWRNRTG